MTIALALLSVELRGNRVEREYSVTASGSYAQSGTTGDLIDFQGASNDLFLARGKFSRVPDGFEVLNQPAGYVMRIEPGVAMDDWGLRFWEAGADGGDLDEIADGAYPAGITGSDGNALRIRLSGKNV